MPDAPGPRFLTLNDVAEELDTSANQIYALVRRGDLEAIKIGGRGQWRVERVKLEQYIEKLYEETRQFIKDNPFDQDAEQGADGAEPSPEPDEVAALAAMTNPLPPKAAVQAGEPHTVAPAREASQHNGAEAGL